MQNFIYTGAGHEQNPDRRDRIWIFRFGHPQGIAEHTAEFSQREAITYFRRSCEFDYMDFKESVNQFADTQGGPLAGFFGLRVLSGLQPRPLGRLGGLARWSFDHTSRVSIAALASRARQASADIPGPGSGRRTA
jgi:hypothetical protein